MNEQKENGKKNNSIINSLKRLERAGSENSRATEKLHDAADRVASYICDLVPSGTNLPMNYAVIQRSSNVGYAKFLVFDVDSGWGDGEDYYVNGYNGYLHGDFQCPLSGQSREGSLRFAKHVADGLLDLISAHLEKQAADADSAADILENSIPEKEELRQKIED